MNLLLPNYSQKKITPAASYKSLWQSKDVVKFDPLSAQGYGFSDTLGVASCMPHAKSLSGTGKIN